MNLSHILIILVPIVLMFAIVVFLVKWFLQSFNLQLRAFTNHEQKKHLLSVKLQACERLAIFLERISPQSLIIREQQHNITSQQFHGHLLKVIRTEFEHNLAMQIYFSGDTWAAILAARDEIVKLINTCAAQVNPTHPSMALGQQIIEQLGQVSSLHQKALNSIKKEISLL